MEIASLVVAVLAMCTAAAAAAYTRGQFAEARRANDLAEAVLAEQREANRVKWIVNRTRSGLALTNIGTEAVEDVQAWSHSATITSGPLVVDHSDPRQAWLASDRVVPNGAIRFMVAGESPWLGEGNELLVSWKGREEPVAVPLPA